jgi:hypothetical protein
VTAVPATPAAELAVVKPPKPIPCGDRRTHKDPTAYLVESGNIDRGHVIGGRSCARHLGDTVAYAATFDPEVRVLGPGHTGEQWREFYRARGGPYAERMAREDAKAVTA